MEAKTVESETQTRLGVLEEETGHPEPTTPKPEVTPTTPKPEEKQFIPGFEAIFAIACSQHGRHWACNVDRDQR